MENLETIKSLEYLVKLASLGSAGISILAVFLIGIKIFNLPDTISKTKAMLLRFFMVMCIIMAVICGVSSWANASFTHDKVLKANNNYNELKKTYIEESQKVEAEKTRINSNLNRLRTQVQGVQSSKNAAGIISEIENTQQRLNQFQVTPYDTVLIRIRKTTNPIK